MKLKLLHNIENNSDDTDSVISNLDFAASGFNNDGTEIRERDGDAGTNRTSSK